MKASLPDELYADLVLVNGHVLTVDPRDSVAEAVAVKGNLIQAVGANEDMHELVGAVTEVVDLREKTLLSQHHVECQTAMSLAQNKPVPVFPLRFGRIISRYIIVKDSHYFKQG